MQSASLASFYEGSDPNGIRTRVTAVKGRCPRPLDDRVGSAGNIGIPVIHARQIGSQIRHVAFNVSIRARESARLRARLRPRVRSTLYARFARDVGARRCLAEVRQQRARAIRHR
jgi:hypothetical protein